MKFTPIDNSTSTDHYSQWNKLTFTHLIVVQTFMYKSNSTSYALALCL